MSGRDPLYTPEQFAARNNPSEPFVTGADLEELISVVNTVMRSPVDGFTLHLDSPHDLDAKSDDRGPLTPGVRRILLVIEHPETISHIYRLYVVSKGPNLQLDAERLLQWIARVERANGATTDAASDLADPAVVRTIAGNRIEARDVSDALAATARETNSVADEVRAAVADTSTWLRIQDDDIVVATMGLYRVRKPFA